MSELLVIASRGPEDPTQVTLSFHIAKAAKEAGKDVAIVLAADASLMATPTLRENVTGVGFPPFRDFYAFMQRSGVPVYIWGQWAKSRGVSVETLTFEKVIDAKKLVELVMSSDKVLTFWIFTSSTLPEGLVIEGAAYLQKPFRAAELAEKLQSEKDKR